MALDVVCGMDVEERDAESKGLTSHDHGRAYYFCSAECKRKFDENPARYAGQPSQQRETGEVFIE